MGGHEPSESMWRHLEQMAWLHWGSTNRELFGKPMKPIVFSKAQQEQIKQAVDAATRRISHG